MSMENINVTGGWAEMCVFVVLFSSMFLQRAAPPMKT